MRVGELIARLLEFPSDLPVLHLSLFEGFYVPVQPPQATPMALAAARREQYVTPDDPLWPVCEASGEFQAVIIQ